MDFLPTGVLVWQCNQWPGSRDACAADCMWSAFQEMNCPVSFDSSSNTQLTVFPLPHPQIGLDEERVGSYPPILPSCKLLVTSTVKAGGVVLHVWLYFTWVLSAVSNIAHIPCFTNKNYLCNTVHFFAHTVSGLGKQTEKSLLLCTHCICWIWIDLSAQLLNVTFQQYKWDLKLLIFKSHLGSGFFFYCIENSQYFLSWWQR